MEAFKRVVFDTAQQITNDDKPWAGVRGEKNDGFKGDQKSEVL